MLITLDKDFGELAIVKGAPHSGIIRLVGMRARDQGPAAVLALDKYASDLVRQAILTSSPIVCVSG